MNCESPSSKGTPGHGPAIDLAPKSKMGLTLHNPVMPAAGCFGFGTEYADLVDTTGLGAIVVGPFTARPRRGVHPPRAVPIADGVLVHTGLANPGLTAAIRRYSAAWERSPVPVIAHVAGTGPDEVLTCCERLGETPGIAAIELGLPDNTYDSEVDELVSAARSSTFCPLIVRLPLAHADELCEAAVSAGADVLTVAAPPRGTVWHKASQRLVQGRLYGRFVHPLVVRSLCLVSDLVDAPLIACGGIHDVDDALVCMRAGAVAVQIGGAMWAHPSRLTCIAASIALAIGRGG